MFLDVRGLAIGVSQKLGDYRRVGEREYLKKTTGFDKDANEKQTEEDAAKEEMKRLFANLCSQLDALSNYHFAPRPVADEADVQNREDVPAIAMEEVKIIISLMNGTLTIGHLVLQLARLLLQT